MHDQPGVGIMADQVFPADAQHAARASRWFIEGAHNAGFGEGFVILNKDQIDHEPDDLTRGKVLPGGFIGELGELADEFFKDRAHLGIADHIGVKIDGGELFGDQIEEVGFGQLLDLSMELETLENITHGRGEGLHVGAEVFPDMILVAHELFQIERGGVVKELPGFLEEERLRIQPGFLAFLLFGKHGGLGGLQNAIQTAQHSEGQDDFAVFGLLVVAPKQIGHGPNE